ncbi:MAG: SEL1-like repeat protein [Endozoicomonas sp.]
MMLKPPASLKFASAFLLVALYLLLTGCQSVRTDGQPMEAGLFAPAFIPSVYSCNSLLQGRSQLPQDLYHTGLCYEHGLAVAPSLSEAVEHYSMAARWGIPEAVQALRRLGLLVPEADLLQRQEHLETEIKRQKSDAARQKLAEERLRLMREDRSYWHHPYPNRHCRRGWCY